MSIYDTNGRNTSRGVEGPVTLDGLDDVTLKVMARYVYENDTLERRLWASNFAARCGVLSKLRDELRRLESEGVVS